MKINKGHIQTGIATFVLALTGQFGVTEFIGNTKLSLSDRQSIVSESLEKTKEYLKSTEYKNDTHKTHFLEFLSSPAAEKEIDKEIIESLPIIPEQVMSPEDRKRWVKLMRKYNYRFPEDNVWNLDVD